MVRRGPKRAEKSRKEPNGAEWGRMGGTGRAEMRSGDGEWGERGLIKVGGLINEVCGGVIRGLGGVMGATLMRVG